MLASIPRSAAVRWIVSALALSASGLAFGAADVPEQVTVAFAHPEKFSDLQDRRYPDERVTQGYMDDLRRFIETHAAGELGPDRKLEVTITDIDMAGELRISGLRDVRVLRSSTPPRINLSFRIVDAGGQVLKSGDRRLTDLSYQFPETWTADTSLFYEKKLLQNWLTDELRR